MTISRPTTRREFTKAMIRYRYDEQWLRQAIANIEGHRVTGVRTTEFMWTWLHRRVCQDASFIDEMVREAFAEKEAIDVNTI